MGAIVEPARRIVKSAVSLKRGDFPKGGPAALKPPGWPDILFVEGWVINDPSGAETTGAARWSGRTDAKEWSMVHNRFAPLRPSRRRGGFTLIEVLVVVAIIALLVAILLPSLARARKLARRTLCANNLHAIGLAVAEYAHTYKEFPHQARVGVPGADVRNSGGNVIGAWPSGVHQVIGRYIGKRSSVRPHEVFYCPAVGEADRGSVDIDREQPVGTIGNPEPYLHITYFYYARLDAGANDPALPRSGDVDTNGDGRVDARDLPARRRMYVTKEPDARKVLMADAVSLWTGGRQWRVNHGPDYRSFTVGSVPPPRLEGQNLAYGDAHVSWQPAIRFPKDLLVGVNLRSTAQLWQEQDYHWW